MTSSLAGCVGGGVVDSKIEAETSPTRTRVKVDGEVTLWCNATGYPPPVVYWSRDDRHRQLQDGSHQYWVEDCFEYNQIFV